MAKRALTAAEDVVWQDIIEKVRRIVAAADRNRLEQTGVLGANASGLLWVTFTLRFGLLYVLLLDLINEDKVRVDDELDPNMGANTGTSTENNIPVANLDLTEELVSSTSFDSIPARAVSVLHELSHAVIESGAFPVKDFGYRKSWNTGYLGAAAVDNADTYAEAAAQIAETVFGPAGAYRERGQATAQRKALQANNCPLGPALAWTDIKINRCWIRSLDYSSFTYRTATWSTWEQTLASWKTDPDTGNKLQIEEGLHGHDNIVGPRHYFFDVGLREGQAVLGVPSRNNATNIKAFFAVLKGRLSSLILLLTNTAGSTLAYDPESETLTVPLGAVRGSHLKLGEAIVDALVARTVVNNEKWGGAYAALQKHKRYIVDLFPIWDRPEEAAIVAQMRTAWDNVTPPAPTAQQWHATAVDVNTAYVLGRADKIASVTEITRQAARNPGKRALLATLHGDIDMTANLAIAAKSRWPTNLDAAQTQRRKEAFAALQGRIADLSQLVVQYYPDKKSTYDAICTKIAGHM